MRVSSTWKAPTMSPPSSSQGRYSALAVTPGNSRRRSGSRFRWMRCAISSSRCTRRFTRSRSAVRSDTRRSSSLWSCSAASSSRVFARRRVATMCAVAFIASRGSRAASAVIRSRGIRAARTAVTVLTVPEWIPAPSTRAVAPRKSPGPDLAISRSAPEGERCVTTTSPSSTRRTPSAGSPWFHSVSPGPNARGSAARAACAIRRASRPAKSLLSAIVRESIAASRPA